MDEPEDAIEDRSNFKVEDKILKIEEDVFLKVDDPDEDQPARKVCTFYFQIVLLFFSLFIVKFY